MAAHNDDHIELTVRRLLSQEELEIRKVLTSEIQGYRGFLQEQFKHLTWALGVLLAFAVGLLIFYFGKSKADLEAAMQREIEQKVIEYKIVDAYKRRLEEYIDVYAKGDSVRTAIDRAVKASAERTVRAGVDAILRARIAEEIKKTQTADLAALLQRAIADLGGIENRIASLKRGQDSFERRQQIAGDTIATMISRLERRLATLEHANRAAAQGGSGQASMPTAGGVYAGGEECGRNMCFDFATGTCRPGPCS